MSSQSPVPVRSQARANRARILEAAISAFAADPDASMDDVAKAAASFAARCTRTSPTGKP